MLEVLRAIDGFVGGYVGPDWTNKGKKGISGTAGLCDVMM